ncbi:PREDICTED: tripartite motif-containing protein 45-like [Amphimedon queenslandica]|uniref:B box-type domain-containing protein n=1 Tax=Amphimedon queenslandica TaxID=400682 RepID=A0AAN0IMP1_AMPQE|nr:PREDICTED: tripartite motif-containing protein 45-like [Amphimedon queenslandica]|eukprot:XP_011404044.2 PREDICTED: tripartite motif-containing protein 45-like [Amphimedon queenslandica]
MAVEPSSSSPGLLKLEEQLTCTEVHSLMQKVADPEKVACDNCSSANATRCCRDCSKFLCKKCIAMHKQWTEFANHKIVSLDEVASAPSEILSKKKAEANLTCLVPSHDEPLKYFCETCDESICRDCAILTHRDHKYNLIADIYAKHCKALERSLNPVKGKIEALNEAMATIEGFEAEVRERGEAVVGEIHNMVEEIIDTVRQSERKLIEQAQMVTDAKLKVLSGQKKSAESSLSLLNDVKDYVEQSLKTGTPQQVLTSKKPIIGRIKEVAAQIRVEELLPIEKNDLTLMKGVKIDSDIGYITYSALQCCRGKSGW